MSICSSGSKKKTKDKKPKKGNPDIDTETVSTDAAEAVAEGDAETALQQGVSPMVIPGFFNNIRGNYYDGNRIIWLTDEISWLVITDVLQKLNFYDDTTKEPIYIYIASPGGLCDAGWALIDMIEAFKKKGYVINTICAGSCSSMAALILSAGTKGHRFAFPSSRIMIHQAGIGGWGLTGKTDEIANEVRELQYWTDLSAKYLGKVTNKTEKDVINAMNYDNYMSAKDALKFGIIDKIKVVLA